MATPRAINTPGILARSAAIPLAVCKIRTNLLDRLAAAVESLGRAKLFLETGHDPLQEQSVRSQLNVLRSECGTIRRDLELHRISHGC